MWYQLVSRTSTTEVETASMIAKDTQLPAPRRRKRRSSDNEELDNSPTQFRRVRLRYSDKDLDVEQRLDSIKSFRIPSIALELDSRKFQQLAASFDRQSF